MRRLLAALAFLLALACLPAPAGAGKLLSTKWTVHFEWPGRTASTVVWTFTTNGTVLIPGDSPQATFTRSKHAIVVTYETGTLPPYHCHAVYTGQIAGGSLMAGTMATNGATGCASGQGIWWASILEPNAT